VTRSGTDLLLGSWMLLILLLTFALATIQHSSTVAKSYKHFLDDNLLFDHIITILQNSSTEFVKLPTVVSVGHA
jgi:hypothetical protein